MSSGRLHKALPTTWCWPLSPLNVAAMLAIAATFNEGRRRAGAWQGVHARGRRTAMASIAATFNEGRRRAGRMRWPGGRTAMGAAGHGDKAHGDGYGGGRRQGTR